MQKKAALDIDPPYRSLIEVSVHVCMCIDYRTGHKKKLEFLVF